MSFTESASRRKIDEMDYNDIMHQVNCLASDLDSLYHQAALKLGLPDSVMMVLYLLYERDGSYPLNEIRKETNISKQTLNSAIRKLESEDIVYLKQTNGREKTVCLTEKGTDYTSCTIARLYTAECNAFQDWAETEIRQYLYLMDKYNREFRKQIETM